MELKKKLHQILNGSVDLIELAYTPNQNYVTFEWLNT